MIFFESELGRHEIPTSYIDLSLDQYISIHSASGDPLKIFGILTGLTIIEMSVLDISEILEQIKFITEEDPSESIPECDILTLSGKTYTSDKNLSGKSWSQKIIATRFLRKEDLVGVLLSYLQPIIDQDKISTKRIEELRPEILSLSVFDSYGAINFITNELIRLIQRDNSSLSIPPTAEQIAAGVHMFDALEEFNTVDMLAGGDPLKYDLIEELPYETIYLKLLKSTITTKFERNYAEVIKAKQE